MQENKIRVTDEDGNELEFEVLFTFHDDDFDKSYVLYYNPEEEERTVQASVYDEEGKLYEIEDPKEWDLVENTFYDFIEQSKEFACCDSDCDCGDDCDCEDNEDGCGCS